MKAYTFLQEVAKNFKGNPILARIKKKPMNRMTSVPPPTTPTGGPPGGQATAPPPPQPAGGVHQMTAPSPGAPNPAQSPQSKNGYVPSVAPPQMTVSQTLVSSSASGIMAAVTP